MEGWTGQVPVGQQLEVFWAKGADNGQDAWFRGQVAAYNPAMHYPYRIEYNDGDVEWVLFKAGRLLDAMDGEEEDDGPDARFTERAYRLPGEEGWGDGTSPEEGAETGQQLQQQAPEQPGKRKRGRPPGSGKKARAVVAAAPAASGPAPQTLAGSSAAADGQPVKRKRGRPSKASLAAAAAAARTAAELAGSTRSQLPAAAGQAERAAAVLPVADLHLPGARELEGSPEKKQRREGGPAQQQLQQQQELGQGEGRITPQGSSQQAEQGRAAPKPSSTAAAARTNEVAALNSNRAATPSASKVGVPEGSKAAAGPQASKAPTGRASGAVAPAPGPAAVGGGSEGRQKQKLQVAGRGEVGPGSAETPRAPPSAATAPAQAQQQPAAGSVLGGAQPGSKHPAAGAPAGAAANGSLAGRPSKLPGGPAAQERLPPHAAAPNPHRTPSSLPGRDPRKLASCGSGLSSTPSLPRLQAESPAVQPAQQQQQQQQQQQPEPAAEQAASTQLLQVEAPQPTPQRSQPQAPAVTVTVIGYHFAAELATVSAAPEEPAQPGSSSRGTTPGGLRRNSSARFSPEGGSGGGPASMTPHSRADAGSSFAGREGSEAGGGVGGEGGGPPSDEELQRRVACKNFERMLPGLTRTKDSIGKATGLALQAAKYNAGPKLVRMVLERMHAEERNEQRVNLLYLVDSILQTSVRQREGRADCGPNSPAGQAYPRVVGAALSKLIEAVARDVQATEKLERVLQIWQRKSIISNTLLEPALVQARTKRAQHEAAWGAEPDLMGGAGVGGAPAAHAAAEGGGPGGGIPGLQGGAAHGTTGAHPAGGGRRAALVLPPLLSGPQAEYALWRLWRRQPMNAVLLLKFIDQKTGGVVQLTGRPHANEWEDMEALRAQAEARGVQLGSPSRADVPAPSTWEEEEEVSLSSSPPPNVSPWHLPSMREAKRSAALASVQQEAARRAAAVVNAEQQALQAVQWAQLAAARRQQESASNEPDEFEREMLQQMAAAAASGPAGAAAQQQQKQQRDPWAQLSTMEAEEAGGLYATAPWNLPGSGAPSAVAAGDGGGSGVEQLPPLPSDAQPPLPTEAPPLPPEEDDFDEGPPPLPAYSPPHDEYMPAEWGGQPPLPPNPPPEDEEDLDAMDLYSMSPQEGEGEGPPPLPPGEAPLGGAAPAPAPAPPPLPPPAAENEEGEASLFPPGFAPQPLLPPGFQAAHHAPPQQPYLPPPQQGLQPPQQHSLLHHQLTPPQPQLPPHMHHQQQLHAPAAPGLSQPAAPAGGSGQGHGSLLGSQPFRTWTGYVSGLVPGSHGTVDSPGADSGFFTFDAVQGSEGLQVGSRVQCEGEAFNAQAFGELHRWRITLIRLDASNALDEEMEMEGAEAEGRFGVSGPSLQWDEEGEEQPLERRHFAQRAEHVQQAQQQAEGDEGKQQHLHGGGQQPQGPHRPGSWPGDLYAAATGGLTDALLDGPPPGFSQAARGGSEAMHHPTPHQSHQPQQAAVPWVGSMSQGEAAYGVDYGAPPAGAYHSGMAHMQQQQQQQQQHHWHMQQQQAWPQQQQQQQQPQGAGLPPGWGPH